MALVIDEYVQTVEDLENIIDKLPDELINAKDSQLGSESLMTPKALATWLTEVKFEPVEPGA